MVIIDLGCANLVQWLHEGDEHEDVGSPVRIADAWWRLNIKMIKHVS